MKQKSNNYKNTLLLEKRLQSAVNELFIANKELVFQNEDKQKRAAELHVANRELTYQNQEKEDRAAELLIANKELPFQNEEKEKRAAELLIANKELAFQNEEKEKRAAELLIANKELAFQNEEKHKRAEELLIANKTLAELNTEQQALFASIVNSSNDAMLSKTLDGIITSWNNGAEQIFGYKTEEITGKHISILIPPYLQHETLEIVNKIRKGKTVEHYETERLKKDGTIFKVSLTISPIRDWQGNITGASKILRDVSERKKAEADLIKSSRMYAFISAINQMIVKTKDEASLFNQACSIAVNVGEFKMAWIGMINEGTKKVIPLAHSGADDDYLSKMTSISIEDIPSGRGLTGKSLREERYIVSNDIENDLHMVPWKQATGERGYSSSIAFPIRKFGKVVGAYSLYAPVKNFFDDTEIALLLEVGGDISFALENFEIAARHKLAEDKIIESEEVFRRLFNESADATLLLDDSGFTRCNTSAVAILGYPSKDELIGKQPWDISPEKQPDERPSKATSKAMIAKALKDGYNRFEWVHLKADGTELHVEVMLTPITLKGVQSFYTVWRDITERKRIENEIQDYKFALDESSLVDISDSTGKIKYANENFRRLSKYSQEELFNQDHRILNSGYHPVELFQDLWATVQAGKIWRNEVRNRAKDGSSFWVDTIIVPFLDNDGKPFQFISIRTDITERKIAEEKLKENYALLNIAGDLAKLGGWTVNLEENRAYWSNEVAAIHEMPAGFAPLVEEGINFYAPEWRDKITEVFTNCAQKGIPYDEDMEILTASGKRIWIRTTGEAVRDDNGKVVKVQGAFQNITERTLAELDREKITADLIQRNQELEQFTYIISHNLRAPVANIKGLSRWLGNDSLPKDAAERITNGLVSSVNKLDTVIIDLNHILQLKNGISGAKERVVFAKLVDSIKGSISTMMLQDDCKIITLFDEVPEMVTLKSYMYSIFYNLISNSIKYKRPEIPLVIDIRSYAQNDKIELIFKDNGRGIDLKKNRSRVFGLYKRFHWDIEGKGMGLFMVKTQVEALGGRISIESEVDKGTEFKIVFANEKNYDK